MKRPDSERPNSTYEQILHAAGLENLSGKYHALPSRNFQAAGLPAWFSHSLISPSYLPRSPQIAQFPNFYKITELSPFLESEAFSETMRAQKRKMLSALHPDRLAKSALSPLERSNLNEIYHMLSSAFEILEKHREGYDQLLQQIQTISPSFSSETTTRPEIKTAESLGQLLGCLILLGMCYGGYQLSSAIFTTIQNLLNP